eukprot:gene8937-60781_t
MSDAKLNEQQNRIRDGLLAERANVSLIPRPHGMHHDFGGQNIALIG